ncbi:MAG: hypothetical protein IKW13_03600 [Thermoguttaceae bacterium]|nr:hypothetical protein [Thermoguttaceae bacterium]
MPQLLKILRYFFLGSAQRVFGAQALTGLLLLGFGASVWTSLRTEIGEQEIYRVKESDFRVWYPPIWVSDRFVAEALELRAPEARTEELNSLDPNLVDNLLIAFESHPWVEKVESIEIRFPARVDVKLKYKEPVAVIDPTPSVAIDLSGSLNDDGSSGQNGINGQDGEKRGAGFGEKYVVDANGYRLPDEYFRNNPSAYRDFPIILGIRSTPVSGFGQCGDPLVVEAAAFARFLAERKVFEKLGINRIVVAKKKGETQGTYSLKSVGGAVVLWGRFGSAEERNGELGETSALQEAKARRLLLLAEKYASLDSVPPEALGELNLTVGAEEENGAENANGGVPANFADENAK